MAKSFEVYKLVISRSLYCSNIFEVSTAAPTPSTVFEASVVNVVRV